MADIKIKFVREYEAHRSKWYDVIYFSGRIYTYQKKKLPRTVRDYVARASRRTEGYDKVFNRAETIYTR